MEIAFWIGVGAVLGYSIGTYYERKDWNALIEKGILPKPRGHHGKF